MLQCRALPALMFLGLAPTMAAFIPVRTTPFACLPPQTLSRTEPRRVFDVALRKPMGLILEELPGRVFVASIATSGSAAIARGAVLPGDRIIAVQGVACEDDDLAGVMERIGAVDSSDVSMRFSRDASVCAVSFESGSVVAGRSGEPLRDVAARAGHAVSYDCETGRCGACEHRVGATDGLLAKYTRLCIMPLNPPVGDENDSLALPPVLELFDSDRRRC